MAEQRRSAAEFGSAPEDITAFNEAIAAVEVHNEQFSLGSMMAKAVIGHMNQTERTQELVTAGMDEPEAEETVEWLEYGQPNLSEEQQMARSILGVTNAGVLEASGLTLSPVRQTAVMFSSKGQDESGEVRLQLADGSRFSSFLHSANPEAVNETFQNNAEKVVSNLTTELHGAIARDEDGAMVAEALVYADSIAGGLEQIGRGESAVGQGLVELAEHAKKGDVREFVLADYIGLLNEPGSGNFGPSEWQKDATAEYLTTEWSKVIGVLKTAQANPRAADLFRQLTATARADLEYAKADWVKLKVEGYDGGSYGQGFEEVFERVGLELDLLVAPKE